MDHRHPPADDSDGDLRKLAEDWITIWQSEITAFMADPETQQSWGSLMALWGGAAQAMVRAMPQGAPYPHAGWPPAVQRFRQALCHALKLCRYCPG